MRLHDMPTDRHQERKRKECIFGPLLQCNMHLDNEREFVAIKAEEGLEAF